MAKKLLQNKKGMELSLETVVIFIILLVTFLVVLYFFVFHYGNNDVTLIETGAGAIDTAKNLR